MDVIQYVAIYLLVVNILGFALMGIDKQKARKHKWRIPEATLFLVAAIGGSIGSLAGMYTFRHKTLHISFKIGMPLILLIQVILVVVIIFSPLKFIIL